MNSIDKRKRFCAGVKFSGAVLASHDHGLGFSPQDHQNKIKGKVFNKDTSTH
jgi:hypothetical protein